jgi:hypothetical protein
MAVNRMNSQYKKIRPAALSRQILSLTGRLETLATAKQPAPVNPPPSTRTGTADPTGGFPMTQRIPLRGGIDMRQQALIIGDSSCMRLSA